MGEEGGQPRGVKGKEQAACDGIVQVTHSIRLGTLRMARPRNGQEVIVQSSIGPSRRLLGNPGERQSEQEGWIEWNP